MMKMSRYSIVALIVLLATSATVKAEQVEQEDFVPNRKEPVMFGIRVHTGFDLGAAVPWPLSSAVGGGNKMSAVPHLTPAFGLSGDFIFNKNWAVVVEGTYKRVAIDVDIRTPRQMFRLSDGDANFAGLAQTEMSFTTLEFPLYVRYTFRKGINRVFLGGYYARILKGKFIANAVDGTLTNTKTGAVSDVTSANPLEQNFSQNIDSWDVGMVFGYERRIFNRAYISGRVSAGFKDVFKPGENYLEFSMWQMRGSFVLSYMLFSK